MKHMWRSVTPSIWGRLCYHKISTADSGRPRMRKLLISPSQFCHTHVLFVVFNALHFTLVRYVEATCTSSVCACYHNTHLLGLDRDPTIVATPKSTRQRHHILKQNERSAHRAGLSVPVPPNHSRDVVQHLLDMDRCAD
jgi:hypothetical protein